VNIANNEKIQTGNVVFYNSTKFGVDVFYQMARQCSVNSVSRVWPLNFFFRVLDIATISAWILYKEFTGNKMSRQNFIVSLADELQQECTCIMHKSSATVLEKDTTSPSSCRRQCQVAKF
jgi:hypothetical protein